MVSVFLLVTVLTAASAVNAETVRFAIIGDRTGDHQPGVYGEILREVERMQPDFVMTVGDQIEGYTDDTTQLNAEWIEYKQLIQTLTMPIYFTPGNHDILSDIQEQVFRDQIGDPYYSFDENGYHFVVLDNGRWERGEQLPAAELNWLNQDLSKHTGARATLVFMHKPFWYNGVAAGRPDTLHEIFKTYGVDAVFTGHFHEYFSGRYDGVMYTGIGSSGGSTVPGPDSLMYHFAWVTMRGQYIDVAPIKINSVLPWDVATAKDMRLADHVRQFAVDIEPLVLGADLKPVSDDFSLTIRNYSPTLTANDTLHWELPDGWTVTPAVTPVSIEPGKSVELNFQAACTGSPYPAPTAVVSLPYKEDAQATIEASLNPARVAGCFPVAAPPKIDGFPDDSVWHDPVTTFFAADGSKATTDPTSFYFAYDSANLYVAARCVEKKTDSIRATVTKHDGAIYAEDCIGLFLQPDRDRPVAYQIYFNSLGYAFDQKLTMNEDGFMDADRGWNGTYDAVGRRGEGFWSIEAVIPLKQLGARGESGSKWGINFRRKQSRTGSAADWQTPIDYNPKTFGVLSLE
jgi:predicted phosphodiesterase